MGAVRRGRLHGFAAAGVCDHARTIRAATFSTWPTGTRPGARHPSASVCKGKPLTNCVPGMLMCWSSTGVGHQLTAATPTWPPLVHRSRWVTVLLKWLAAD